MNSKTRTYNSWKSMKARCLCQTATGYNRYGGKGIKICKRWEQSFRAFLNDMGIRPIGTSLDRKNNDGDYKPSNCRWATNKEQSNNSRNAVFITFNGKKQTVTQWSKETGIGRTTLAYRIKRGLPINKVLTLCVYPGEPFDSERRNLQHRQADSINRSR